MTSNLQQWWNNYHQRGDILLQPNESSPFVEKVNKIIPKNSSVLELGCGIGSDSYYLAKHGYKVLATDIAGLAVKKNQKKHKDIPNLHFEQLDISLTFPYSGSKFDVVYARLSLHYFKDQLTKAIFREVARVLKPGGYFCFECKSTKDPYYGLGDLIEKDMFIRKGHFRHFFSLAYTKECLQNLFEIIKLDEHTEEFHKQKSIFIDAIIRKKF